jgi:5'-nucleotidase
MPHAPELDFVTDKINTDDTMGGFSRIATVLSQERKKRSNPVITVDSGDFTMGTLFHMIARKEASELCLMHMMGYDYVTLGNHEFDMFPEGLAGIIKAAYQKKMLPEIVFSSAVFSDKSSKDDELEAVFAQGLVKPYTIVEKQGLRIGFYGIMGKIAAGDAPFASPVTFSDPIETSRRMVEILRDQEKVDIVVCLSHTGLGIGVTSEDETMAEEVDGIDIIISGHSHSFTPDPILVDNTIIVQAGKYGEAVGVLDVVFDNKKVSVKEYNLIAIDDRIAADFEIQSEINGYIKKINEQVLKEHGLSYWKIIGSTDFDLPIAEKEATAGNLLADAVRWYAQEHDFNPGGPRRRIDMAIKANGVIRAGILKGKTGKLAVADIFRTLPLGIGMDEDKTPGYPLVGCYIYGYEIKRALEVVTSVYPLRGSAYFLQLSGVRFTYNPYRMLFDRVTDIEIQTKDGSYASLDYSRSNKQLYRVAANIYEATFLQVIGDYTYNILKIVPKDRYGDPIESMVDFRIDADPSQSGIQELKEWVAVIDYIAGFEDKTGDGLADIPDKYRSPEGRIKVNASLNPINLVYPAGSTTLAALGAILVLAVLVFFIFRLTAKIIRKNR